ncbi:MAG: guanylate cyclase [Eggerthellaceae bacterium]|jgi:Co/Zn/Cd efflux system component|nr:guanylate cyclase [Eggerthellaceae bacterium]
MFARIYRIIPLVIVLALLAGIIYVVAAWRYSPNKAKEILIRAFTAITGAISIFFALATLYAAMERNWVAVELAASFLAVAAGGLVVTRICRAVFVKHHPHYADAPVKAEVVNEPLGKRFLRWLAELISLNMPRR